MDSHQSALLGQEISIAIETGFNNAVEHMRHDQRVKMLADLAIRIHLPPCSPTAQEAIRQAQRFLFEAEIAVTAEEDAHQWSVRVNPGGFKGQCSCGWSAWQPTKEGLDGLYKSHFDNAFRLVPEKPAEMKPHRFDGISSRGHVAECQIPGCGKPESDPSHTPF